MFATAGAAILVALALVITRAIKGPTVFDRVLRQRAGERGFFTRVEHARPAEDLEPPLARVIHQEQRHAVVLFYSHFDERVGKVGAQLVHLGIRHHRAFEKKGWVVGSRRGGFFDDVDQGFLGIRL